MGSRKHPAQLRYRVENIISRNEYLKKPEFSDTDKLSAASEKGRP